jgi:AcrR family transcriptional regulator
MISDLDPKTPLRERKKRETSRRAMTNALRLFEERGYDEVTVEEIADAATISPRTFFRYFPTKADVLFGDHLDRVALLERTIADRPAGESVPDAVRKATLAELERMAAEPEVYLARTRVVTSIPAARAKARDLDAAYEEVIARAVAEPRAADPATDLRARVVARSVWGAVRSAQHVWHATGGRADPEELVDEAFGLLADGIA